MPHRRSVFLGFLSWFLGALALGFAQAASAQTIPPRYDYGIHQFELDTANRSRAREARLNKINHAHSLSYAIDSIGVHSDSTTLDYRYTRLPDGRLEERTERTDQFGHLDFVQTMIFDPYDRKLEQSVGIRNVLTEYHDSIGLAIAYYKNAPDKQDTFTYDKKGNPLWWKPAGTTEQAQCIYDDRGRIQSLTRFQDHHPYARQVYRYDPTGLTIRQTNYRFDQASDSAIEERGSLIGDFSIIHCDPIRHIVVDSMFLYDSSGVTLHAVISTDSLNHILAMTVGDEVTEMRYDPHWKLLKTTVKGKDQVEASYKYDEKGLLLRSEEYVPKLKRRVVGEWRRK